MIHRISEVMVNVDGTLMIDKGGNNYVPYMGNQVSSIQLQNLYLFLHREEVAKRDRFFNYVDKLIDKLIYNR